MEKSGGRTMRMQFMAAADTDIGTSRPNNQDGVLLKHARWADGEVLLAVVCDGMGGLLKGEVASATVIRAFSDWFGRELPYALADSDLRPIAEKWSLMLKSLNIRIMEYGKRTGIKLGTTFTGVLFVGDSYLAVHVGDSRFYQLTSSLEQLTTDQTFVAMEVAKGTMTAGQAKRDKRRNLLLQCIGASECFKPEIRFGKIRQGAYMLCTDGFCHEIDVGEMYDAFHADNFSGREAMRRSIRDLINRAKAKGEKDNISVILIKADAGAGICGP